MPKIVAALSIIVLGLHLAAPAVAQDLGAPRNDHDPRMHRAPDLEVRPRGQREQVAPPGDAYSTEEPDADDDDLDDPEDAPADRRL